LADNGYALDFGFGEVYRKSFISFVATALRNWGDESSSELVEFFARQDKAGTGIAFNF